MSHQYTTGDLAGHLGITSSQVFRELQALPHHVETGGTRFSEEEVREVERILNAGPDAELARLQLLDEKLADLQAQDDMDDEDEDPDETD